MSCKEVCIETKLCIAWESNSFVDSKFFWFLFGKVAAMRDMTWADRGWRLRRFIFCGMMALMLPTANGQPPKLAFDGLVDSQRANDLLGKPAVVQLMSGVVISDSEIVGFLEDRRSGSLQFIQYKDGARSPKRRASEVYRMLIAAKTYTLRYHGPTQGYYLIDRAQAETDAVARIGDQNRELRSPQTPAEIEEAVGVQKAFFNDASKMIGAPSLGQYESEFSLVLTDYPEPYARQLARYMDQTCQRMNQLFGLPQGSNIWNGKVLVAVFRHRPLFESFESKAMQNNNFGSATTIYHNNSQRFLVACSRETLDKSLARTLCWSVAGGFVERYRSNVRIPDWLRTGVREWSTDAMFPDARKLASQRKQTVRDLQRANSLMGILSATNIEDERLGTAKLIVAQMIQTSPPSFSQFFEDVKLGHPFESALQSNFSLTPAQFASAFGSTMGVGNVSP